MYQGPEFQGLTLLPSGIAWKEDNNKNFFKSMLQAPIRKSRLPHRTYH